MRQWLCFILLLITISHKAEADIRRWDALPAIDVMHLQGPHAGKAVCPMCRHGYDAGVLMFVPSSTAPENAGRIARALQAVATTINDDRFRPFLILTGAVPSKELLAAVKSKNSNWYVAHLSTQALDLASKDYELPLQDKSIAYVFSQRRLLWSFNPQDANTLWTKALVKYADYAMTFLHSNYATPVKSNNPDTPKGRLWMAPAKLSTKIELAKTQSGKEVNVCVSDSSRLRQSDAMVALTTAGTVLPKRTRWVRTDKTGCFVLSGMQAGLQLEAEIFSVLKRGVAARIDGQVLQRDGQLEIALQSIGAIHVSGNEVVVGLPCEGCEGAFQGLPTRLAAWTTLSPPSEPGDPLLISGVVKNSTGVPQPGVVIYAYQTNKIGKYPTDPRLSGAAALHGRLRGWVQTDSAGTYSFNTIRPGGYPGEDIPQHIHLHVIEPSRCTYYVGDVLFNDDPRLTAALRYKARNAYGGSGIVKVEGNKNSGWRVIRNITLGLNVPGYRTCSR